MALPTAATRAGREEQDKGWGTPAGAAIGVRRGLGRAPPPALRQPQLVLTRHFQRAGLGARRHSLRLPALCALTAAEEQLCLHLEPPSHRVPGVSEKGRTRDQVERATDREAERRGNSARGDGGNASVGGLFTSVLCVLCALLQPAVSLSGGTEPTHTGTGSSKIRCLRPTVGSATPRHSPLLPISITCCRARAPGST